MLTRCKRVRGQNWLHLMRRHGGYTPCEQSWQAFSYLKTVWGPVAQGTQLYPKNDRRGRDAAALRTKRLNSHFCIFCIWLLYNPRYKRQFCQRLLSVGLSFTELERKV